MYDAPADPSPEDLDKLANLLDNNIRMIEGEHDRVLASVNFDAWAGIISAIKNARRIFVIGNGRSGLAIRMAAMRLMHLGFAVHVVGDVTTPAIGAEDLLVAVSGSGSTATVVHAAEIARSKKASVAVITTVADSPLARLATIVLPIPAPEKHDSSGVLSSQYAGSLFEQSVLTFTDGLFHTMWKLEEVPAAELLERHSDLG